MDGHNTLCLVGKLPDCGCVAVHCVGYKSTPVGMLNVLVEAWLNVGLTVDLVDTATCKQTYQQCIHRSKWYTGLPGDTPLSSEAISHAGDILKTIAVMRALADIPPPAKKRTIHR